MLLAVVTVCVLLVVMYSFPIVKICGDSMSPTLLDGEYCLGRRVFRKKRCRVGSIYVYRPPNNGKSDERYVVKRLVAKVGNMCFFLGDNRSSSYDSRHYGYVSSRDIVARVKSKRRSI